MNREELARIKEKALEEHIPIIMDDTLEVIEKYLKDKKPEKFLEMELLILLKEKKTGLKKQRRISKKQKWKKK